MSHLAPFPPNDCKTIIWPMGQQASAHHRRFINKDRRQWQDGRVNDTTAVSSPPGGVMDADIGG